MSALANNTTKQASGTNGEDGESTATENETPATYVDVDRKTQAVDSEQPPRLPFSVVGIGASAGGLESFIGFFSAMPPDSGMAFVLIQHLPPERESLLIEILERHTQMKVLQVDDGMVIQPNHVYAARPGHTLSIKNGKLHLGERLTRPGHSRPVDDFFRTLAEEQQERAIGIIMSGMGSNGSAGAQAIKTVGGMCIAQDPDSAKFPSMPRHLIDQGQADFVLAPAEMPPVLLRYIRHPYASSAREQTQKLLEQERQQFNDVVGIIRSRMRMDFSGYKKPTILRRIQRRMGLHQINRLVDYARLLRQNPTEVHALSDDLLIHVTGFFRDADAWQTLSKRVIKPLVAERESNSSIRCWVTACSSGEEAYTLAMLLVEAAELIDKRLDIKIFATDTAERSLGHARSGIYPAGIEAEISPERLNRFFEKEDGMYRVKKDLRELVIFAPHNLLNDPPFSRIDIVTCRNLLIYLEPEMQQRVLAVIHFGLREGGSLLLGSSETISYTENMFEPIESEVRLFRRVGPTHHGIVEFPTLRTDMRIGDVSDPRPSSRISIAQITNKVLLENYTPAAVTIDREHRIVYFHGHTERFLSQPRGEPTRDVLAVARDGVRAVLRAALQQYTSSNGQLAVAEGPLYTDKNVSRRVVVTVAPLESKLLAGHILVSFEQREITANTEVVTPPTQQDQDRAQEALIRLRDELQSTIEELQSSNEELKASNEEVASVNEELQSTNEEMETSKEELQSLNEELVTANAQLQAKMGELEAMTNDLKSLLSSTDIAVIFLDTRFYIRRYTPAIKDLIELIPSDVGRPLSDLATKFTDPFLMRDVRDVLERLVPVAREVTSQSGRHYLRRTLPYRTSDNRIDGVVITFVDISERKSAEEVLRQSKLAAEEAARAKDEFVATLSHELRTPLSAILLWSKMLREKKITPAQVEEGLESIEKSAEAQRAMIDDLLDTSRIASGKLRLELRTVSLAEVIRNAIEAIRPTAMAKSIKVIADPLQDVGPVLADPERLQQVLWNLLNNAVKFTPTGGSVTVTLRRESEYVEIAIKDTGIGIRPEFLAEMFVRFRQADSSTTRRHGGLGLGLAISKQLIELHGGTIHGQSEGIGKGSTFSVRLPLLTTIPPEISAALQLLSSNDNGGSQAETHFSDQSQSLTSVKILLVEDETETRNALTSFLTLAGATVTPVESAQAAIDAYGKQAPDLIVSDIGLPKMDGCALIRKIRTLEKQKAAAIVPAVALTAFTLEKDQRRILESGFHRYVRKPIEPGQLIPMLRVVLRKG